MPCTWSCYYWDCCSIALIVFIFQLKFKELWEGIDQTDQPNNSDLFLGSADSTLYGRRERMANDDVSINPKHDWGLDSGHMGRFH